MFGGVLNIVWFLYKNPGFTEIVTQDLFGEKFMAILVMAANSETLFPDASATRKSVFIKR